MLRILNIENTLQCVGGRQTTIMNFYRHIDKSKVQFDFLVTDDINNADADEVRTLGARIFRRPWRTRNPIGNAIELFHVLRRYKDIGAIHIHTETPIFVIDVMIACLCGVPVRIVHSRSASPDLSLFEKALRSLLRFFTTHTLACSTEAGIALFGKPIIKKNQLMLMPNARSLTPLLYNEKIRTLIRKELCLDNKFVLFNVGRLVPLKNQRMLLRIFSLLTEQNEAFVLLIAGQGELHETLQRTAEQLGIADKVKLLGFRDDISDLMQTADIFLLPSRYEGLPGAAIEAQIAGLPCLLSDTITKESDITGLVEFLPLSNIELWAERIHSIYRSKSPRRNMYDEVTAAGYNIIDAAKKLERFYLDTASQYNVV
jgi:glycosyltransferase involved in cell wall biosynthesis